MDDRKEEKSMLSQFFKILRKYFGANLTTDEFVSCMFSSITYDVINFPSASLPQKLYNGNSKLSKKKVAIFNSQYDRQGFIEFLDSFELSDDSVNNLLKELKIFTEKVVVDSDEQILILKNYDNDYREFVTDIFRYVVNTDISNDMKQLVDLPTDNNVNNRSQVHKEYEKQKSEIQNNALKKYYEYLKYECGKIRFDGMPVDGKTSYRELDIDSIYVPLRLKKTYKYLDSESALQRELEDKFDELFGDIDEEDKEKLAAIFDETKTFRAAILASPGAGKSTFLKKVVMECIYQNSNKQNLLKRKLFPIYIKCRSLKQSSIGSIVEIIKRIPKIAEFDVSDTQNLDKAFLELVDYHIQSGSALVLIDGLDEIANKSNRKNFVNQLKVFLTQNPSVNCILTSRLVGFRAIGNVLEKDFLHYEIEEFDNNDIKQLCENWYKFISGERNISITEANNLAKIIISNDRIKRLATNPLLLTTLLLVKMRVGRLPTKRLALYEESIKLLLETWNIESYEPVDLEEAKCQLAYLALHMTRNGMKQIKISELKNVLKEARSNLLAELSPDMVHSSVLHFVENIEYRSSLLIRIGEEDGEYIYEFQHLTFQEYLSAFAIVKGYYSDCDYNESTTILLAKHYFDADWEEVILQATVLSERRARNIILDILNCFKNKTVSSIDVFPQPIDVKRLLLKLILDEVQILPELRTQVYSMSFSTTYHTSLSIFIKELMMSKYYNEFYTYVISGFKNSLNQYKPNFLWCIPYVLFYKDPQAFYEKRKESLKDLLSSDREKFFYSVSLLDMSLFDEKYGENTFEPLSNQYVIDLESLCLEQLFQKDLDRAYYYACILYDLYDGGRIKKGTNIFSSNKCLTLLFQMDKSWGNDVSEIRPCWFWNSVSISHNTIHCVKNVAIEIKNHLQNMYHKAKKQYKIAYFKACVFCDGIWDNEEIVNQYKQLLIELEDNDISDRYHFDEMKQQFTSVFSVEPNTKNREEHISSKQLECIEYNENYTELGDEFDSIITLDDESGNMANFEFLDLIKYNGEEYVVLLPIEDADGEVVILKIADNDDDENEAYVSVDDDTSNKVFTVFKERSKEKFDFTE